MDCPEIYWRVARKLQGEGCLDRANGRLGSLANPTPVELLKPWIAAQFNELKNPLSVAQLDAIATRLPELFYTKGEDQTELEYAQSYYSELTLIAAILWWSVPELAEMQPTEIATDSVKH